MHEASTPVWPATDWPASSPAEQGFNDQLLEQMDHYVQTENTNFRAILVIRHGALVFERYYQGQQPQAYHRVASITKSILSTLIGSALQKGYFTTLDQPLVSFFPNERAAITDTRIQEVTLRHLLTMTGGLACDEYADYDKRWEEGGDQWARFALSRPIAHKPGTTFQYSSLGVHLLSIILTQQTGMSTLEFARQALFTPLGIATDEQTGFTWMQDPQGYYRGGGGLRLRAQDLARLGYLYLHRGQWRDQHIFTIDYHQQATSQQNAGGPPINEGYGYLWWITSYHGHHTYFASGIGGQILAIIPALDLIVVILSANQYHPQEHLQRQIIPQFIIPAITEQQ